MKIMSVSMEENDCAIDIVTPPKKKMKQARLPFQMLSSPKSPNTVSGKKRKLQSPSAIDSRSSKVVKIITKENVAAKAVEQKPEVIELDDSVGAESKNVEATKDTAPATVVEEVEKVEEKARVKEVKRSKLRRNKKTESKQGQTKFSTLTAFLKKADSKEGREDIQLLPMSDYENESSDKSNVASKKDVDSDGEESVSNNESVVSVEIDTDGDRKAVEEKSDNATSKSTASKTKSERKEMEKSSSPSLDKSDIVTLDSESDDAASSSNEDADNEQEKSITETRRTEPDVDGGFSEKLSKSGHLTAESPKNRKLTPKQKERMLESAKKREEKQRLRKEKERKREEDRENRRKEKEERRKEREEKEKAEKEQKRKEKELKELKKQMEIEHKQKEKEAKEEDRRKREEAKEEEKRRKEEERLEVERKKQKEASNFASFFFAKKQESKLLEEEEEEVVSNFMPFEVKVDMRVAPIRRKNLNEHDKLKLDEVFTEGHASKSELYLTEIKNGRREIGKSERTWPPESKDDIVVIEEDDDDGSNLVNQGNAPTEKLRAKMLMFAENRRPPYWGTWRKKSRHVNPRRPFSKDSKWFDYEVDSDEEWEEEEPGESLKGSDDEKDEENPDDNEYDVDNEFMVPHGYLSDGEARDDEEDEEDMSPETQKVKLKLLGEEFLAEMNKKTAKIKPKVIGCIWQTKDDSYPENVAPKLVQFLTARRAWTRETPVVLCPAAIAPEIPDDPDCEAPTERQSLPGAKKTKVPAEAIPDIIRLVHGNTHGRTFLIKEFMAFWEKKAKETGQKLSKASLSQKIKELGKWMACPEEGPMHLKASWYVSEDTRKRYNCADVGLPNRWSYTLTPKRRSEAYPLIADKQEKSEKEREKENKKRVPLITQFTKKLTPEEMQKQLTVKGAPQSVSTQSVGSSPSTAPQPGTSRSTISPFPAPRSATSQRLASPTVASRSGKSPKRAALISVGRGEQFPKSLRENLLAKCAKRESEKPQSVDDDDDDDDVVIIDDVASADSESVEKKQNDKAESDLRGKQSHDFPTAFGKSMSDHEKEKLDNCSMEVDEDDDISRAKCKESDSFKEKTEEVSTKEVETQKTPVELSEDSLTSKGEAPAAAENVK